MKHLVSINELYSPKTISEMVDIVTKFIIDKLDNWFSKSNIYNYSYMYKIKVPVLYKDFPASLIKLSLKFSFTNDKKLSTTGISYVYIDDDNSKYRPRMVGDNTEISIGFKYLVPKSLKSMDFKKEYDDLKPLVAHELTHSYQSYKKKSKGIDGLVNTQIAGPILNIFDDFRKYNIAKFLRVVYVFSNRLEIGSGLTEVNYADKPWVKDFKMFYSMSFSDIFEYINKGLSEDDKQYILDSFDTKSKSFESLIKNLFNILERNKDRMYKKILKIEHSKK